MPSKCRAKLTTRIRSELCRIDPRCVLIGAGVVLLLGFISALVSRSPGFRFVYRVLRKPPGAPPAFIFPVVWTLMYALIGGAAGAVVCSCEKAFSGEKWRGTLFFVIGLVFNLVWSPLFFGMGAFFAAFLAILVMIASTVFAISAFSRIWFVSAAAMCVYLVWLIYAAYLNLGVIVLN